MLRVVPDVNVLVSGALYSQGPSGRIRAAWRRGELAIVTSHPIIGDLDRVLHRPRIMGKYPITDELVQAYLTTLRKRAILTPAVMELRVVEEDPDDNVVVVTAVEGQADYIVSGDLHLRRLQSYAGIPILTPADFIAQENIA